MIKRIIYFTFFFSLWMFGISLEAVLASSLITLFVTYIIIPAAFYFSLSVRRHLIFLNYVNYPFHIDFECPEKEGISGTRNFYLETDYKVKVGVWHVLPECLVPGSPKPHDEGYEEWYEKSLGDGGHPVVLYLHGNTASRAAGHRIELYILLRKMNFHVVTFDYRGYADSSHRTPSETRVVKDARAVYEYIRNRVGQAVLIVWGHSLGTGVSSHAVADLCREGYPPSALILEAPFSNMRDEITSHPLSSIFRKMPCYKELFLDVLKPSDLAFESDRYIGYINAPVLILHAEDDLVVPFSLGEKLHKTALKTRPECFPPVEMFKFEAKLGWAHKFICRDPRLPSMLRNFLLKHTKLSEM